MRIYKLKMAGAVYNFCCIWAVVSLDRARWKKDGESIAKIY